MRTVRRSPVKVRRLIEKKVKTSFSTYREIILTGRLLLLIGLIGRSRYAVASKLPCSEREAKSITYRNGENFEHGTHFGSRVGKKKEKRQKKEGQQPLSSIPLYRASALT
jgi:hypothetical protein